MRYCLNEFIYTILIYSLLGTDLMRSKSKRKIIAEKKTKNSKHKLKQNQTTNYARRCVTHRATSLDEQCPMRILLILSSNKQWFLLSTSSLKHLYHPPLEEQAIVHYFLRKICLLKMNN